MARKLLLIDGDQFVFTAAVAIEQETRWDDNNHVLYASPELAWVNFENMLLRIFDRFETHDHVLTFSGPNNFRYEVDPTYKSNRKGARKPMCYAAIRELCDAHYNTLVMEGLEADDVMGILQTKPGSTQRIIVSQDKDMKTIPGTLWTGKDLLQITEDAADYNHLYQTLIGDATDSVKGCPGVGPVKASSILSPEYLAKAGITAWRAIAAAYEKAGLSEEVAIQQARLVRILRWSDWDGEKQEADPVDTVMKAVGGAIIWGIIVLLVLAALPKHPETKPREYPLWCHNAKDISKSGVCSKVKGLAWSI